SPRRRRLFADPATPNSALPFIPAEEVISTSTPSSPAQKFLVIDEIVYDVSTYISSHPGGEAVVQSFVGQDCSWQFARFHGRDVLGEGGEGWRLRVGRTKGVKNRFKEPVRFVGLRRLGGGGW
ncbi:uncharacterized protein BDZ99DRAFT_342184, partial [Mytilinidion resinicola]